MKIISLSKTVLAAAIISLAVCSSIEPNTLKDALKGKFHIGAALNTRQFTERDTADVRIIKHHFNSIVAENCMKPMYLQPREGEFFFEEADKFIEFGERNGMCIVGHTLIWHSQLPRWFCVDENGEKPTYEVLRELLPDRWKYLETQITIESSA